MQVPVEKPNAWLYSGDCRFPGLIPPKSGLLFPLDESRPYLCYSNYRVESGHACVCVHMCRSG